MTTGFTFGASSSTPNTSSGGLFGSVSKPTFGTTATQAPTALTTTGLFGTSATTASSSTTTGLFGNPAVAKTTAGSSVGLFGSQTSTTTAPSLGLFGTVTSTNALAPTVSATSAGVTGSILSQTTAALGSTNAPSSSGLGGTGSFLSGGNATNGTVNGGSVGVTGLAASGNPMEGEVPKQVMDLITLLKEQIKANKEKADEFAMDSSDACVHIDEKLDGIKKLQVQQCSELRRAMQKVNALSKKGERDVYAGEQLARRQKEAGKNPHYGQNLAMEYLQATCSDYETNLINLVTTLQRLETVVAQLNGDQDKPELSKEDLMKFLERFDQIFKSVAAGVYECNQQVQEAKEAFLEIRRTTHPYASNPFLKKFSNEKIMRPRFAKDDLGADAFPSQVTLMKIGELAKVATPSTSAIGSTTSAFGTSGSLFGSKTMSAPFSFNATNTSGSLFKPFNASSTSTAPLFGGTKTTNTNPSLAPSFTFGNTLNSTASGTLFGGSASKPFGK